MPRKKELTALDWIGVVVVLLSMAALLWMTFAWMPALEQMYKDFGSRETLPGLTRFVLSTSPWLALGLMLLGLLMLLAPVLHHFRGRPSVSTSRWMAVLSFVLITVFGMLCWWSMTLPIHSLAEAIQ